jgi:uncharacterized protein (UPF0332 family)
MIDWNEFHYEYIGKAVESLIGAESEMAAGRHNNAANRAYYAAFQAVLAALIEESVSVTNIRSGQILSHKAVISFFDGLLIGRRHRFPPELRGTLQECLEIRRTADYSSSMVSFGQADRTVRRSRMIVDAVRQHLLANGSR